MKLRFSRRLGFSKRLSKIKFLRQGLLDGYVVIAVTLHAVLGVRVE